MGGGDLAYKKYSEGGENLIILHGLFGTLDNWHTLATRFSADFTVYTIDQRNHGKSPHYPEMDYNELALDIADFMHHHKIPDAYIIGHSMGGKTAMQMAISWTRFVKKLIVVDIAPKAYDATHGEYIDALKKLNLSEIKTRNQADEILAKSIQYIDTRLFLLKNLIRQGDTYQWKMNLPAIEANYEALIGKIGKGIFNGETLFISGAKSDYILPTDIENIKKKFPNASFVTVPNAGHWVHAENPEGFYQEVMKFLSPNFATTT